MKNRYTIPLYNMSGESNKKTIQNAIELLNGYYIVNFEFMSEHDRIKALECIAGLSNIYFNMKQAEVKQ